MAAYCTRTQRTEYLITEIPLTAPSKEFAIKISEERKLILGYNKSMADAAQNTYPG